MAPRYAKEMPGAEQTFRPGNLNDYAGESWDIRVSIGDEPLDEAFFFSVAELADADRPVRELLEEFALNPAREAELELEDFPDLPFLQQELIQFYAAAEKGQFELRVFVNGVEGELDLDAPARDLLARCAFLDHSWDYLVLDLVFEAQTPPPAAAEVDAFLARHPELGTRAEIEREAAALAEKYAPFASVSIAPAALGVPDGFDVRFQMMEFDGLDIERCALVEQLAADAALELADALGPTRAALAFKTNFTAEILNELKALENA